MANTQGALRVTMKLATKADHANLEEFAGAIGRLQDLKQAAKDLGFVIDGDVVAKADRFAFPETKPEGE